MGIFQSKRLTLEDLQNDIQRKREKEFDKILKKMSEVCKETGHFSGSFMWMESSDRNKEMISHLLNKLTNHGIICESEMSNSNLDRDINGGQIITGRKVIKIKFEIPRKQYNAGASQSTQYNAGPSQSTQYNAGTTPDAPPPDYNTTMKLNL